MSVLPADVAPSNATSQPQSNEQLISAIVAGAVLILFVALAIITMYRRRRSKDSPRLVGVVLGKQSDCSGADTGDASGRNKAAAGYPATHSGGLAGDSPHRSGVQEDTSQFCSGTAAGEEAHAVEIQLANLRGTVRNRVQYCPERAIVAGIARRYLLSAHRLLAVLCDDCSWVDRPRKV